MVDLKDKSDIKDQYATNKSFHAALKRFSFNCLKIDKSFADNWPKFEFSLKI